MSETLKAKLDYIKNNFLYEQGAYNLVINEKNPITPEEAKFLYEMDDFDYSIKIGIPKEIIYFFLSDEDKIKHINSVGNFYVVSSAHISLLDVLTQNSEVYSQVVHALLKNHNLIYSSAIYDTLPRITNPDHLKELVIFLLDVYPFPNDKNQVIDIINNSSMPSADKLECALKFVETTNSIPSSLPQLLRNLSLEERTKFLENLPQLTINSNHSYMIDCLYTLNYDTATSVIDNWISNNRNAIQYLAVLQPKTIIEIMEKHDVSIEEFDRMLGKDILSEDSARALYNMIANDPELKVKYINDEIMYNFKDCFSDKELLDIFQKDILTADHLSEYQKCSVIYSLFQNDNRIKALDIMLSKPYTKEMDIFFDELINDTTYEGSFNDLPHMSEYLAKRYQIENRDNLITFLNKFSMDGVRFLTNSNVVGLINMPKEQFDQMMSLFTPETTNLTMKEVNEIANAFIQRQFRLQRPDDYNIFSKFETLLQNKTKENVLEVVNLLQKINTVVDASSMVGNVAMNDFVTSLFDHDSAAMDKLHTITNAYIAKQRELFSAANMGRMIDSLNIYKRYNRTYMKKAYFIYNPNYYAIRRDFHTARDNLPLDYEESALLNDAERLDAIINFKQNPASVQMTPVLKHDLRIIDTILDKMYDQGMLTLATVPEDAKYDYIVPEIENESILSILANISPKQLQANILSNPETFSRLQGFLKKYKLVGWGDVFDPIESSIDLGCDTLTIASLISYFDKIDKITNKKGNLTDVLDFSNAYASSSNKYPLLLGKENYDLIVSNPGPNKSSAPKETRLGQVPGFIRKMYQRNGVPVPNGTKTIDLGENKSLRVTVGDIYNPMNMTLGERTGACLRISGAFRDLFEYCLTDDNGFHITITNPVTGAFVSRVSCIRNGNTIFLNELRHSVDPEYSDEELIKCIREISKMFVESTRDDPHPIENVVVSNDYAMSDEEQEDLGIEDPSTAFTGLNFNITSHGHILYTASEDHKTLLPYKFGPEHASMYAPHNTTVRFTSGEKAKEAILQTYLIDRILQGEELSDINLSNISNNINQCIYGYGWVVYVDENGEIHEHIIDKFKNDRKLRELIKENKKNLGGGGNDQVNGKNNRV